MYKFISLFAFWLTVRERTLFISILISIFHIYVIFHLVEYNLFVYDCQSKEGEMKKGKERRECKIRKNQVRKQTQNSGKTATVKLTKKNIPFTI